MKLPQKDQTPNILVSSDWHKRPLSIVSPELSSHLDYLDRKLNSGWDVVLAGDLFDALDCGWPIYETDPIVHWLARHTQLPNLHILEGNHDRKSPYFPQQKSLFIDGTYISHWSEFDMLWGWLPIYSFPMPSFLYKWYTTPAKKKANNDPQKKDWHISTAWCEFWAQNYAILHDCAVVGGHTHSSMTLEREGVIIANCGDMRDSFSWSEKVGGKWQPKTLT